MENLSMFKKLQDGDSDFLGLISQRACVIEEKKQDEDSKITVIGYGRVYEASTENEERLALKLLELPIAT